MKKTLTMFLGLVLGLILMSPGFAQAASGGQVPGGGNQGGNSGAIGSTQAALNVGFSFSTTELTCNQDNNVSLTVTNQGPTGTVVGVGIGFESQYNPDIKSPLPGQENEWSIEHLDNNGYKGPTWSTVTANAIKPGENATFSARINVPCGPTEIKVLGAATSSPKLDPVITRTTFKMVSGVTVLPKTGADSSSLYYFALLALPALGTMRKFIK